MKNKFRMCEILGVDVGSEFVIEMGNGETYCAKINENGAVVRPGDRVDAIPSTVLSYAINHPENLHTGVPIYNFTKNEQIVMQEISDAYNWVRYLVRIKHATTCNSWLYVTELVPKFTEDKDVLVPGTTGKCMAIPSLLFKNLEVREYVKLPLRVTKR